MGDLGLILGLGRSPAEGNGKLLQYPCLKNSMDRGAWWAPWGHKEADTTEWLHILFWGLGTQEQLSWVVLGPGFPWYYCQVEDQYWSPLKSHLKAQLKVKDLLWRWLTAMTVAEGLSSSLHGPLPRANDPRERDRSHDIRVFWFFYDLT